MDASLRSYKDLIVWQKAMQLVDEIYAITKNFPADEKYGLTSQIRRASVSIPSNIAEGRRRGSRIDYRKFLLQAYGSGAELETQLEIAVRQKYIRSGEYTKLIDLLAEVMKMLNVMISKLQAKKLES